MADLQDMVITDLANVSVVVNSFRVECHVTESAPQALIGDYTGANALVFPAVLATLTAAQRRTLLRGLMRRIILIKAGQDDGSAGDL